MEKERETCRGLWEVTEAPGRSHGAGLCTWDPGRGLASSCLSLQRSRAAPASNFPKALLLAPATGAHTLRTALHQLQQTRGLSAVEAPAFI